MHVDQGGLLDLCELDYLLHDFDLGERDLLRANAVGRHLPQVFKQGDAPAKQHSYPARFASQIFQTAAPRKSHEHVALSEQCGGR